MITVKGFSGSQRALHLLPNSKLPDTARHPKGHKSPVCLDAIEKGSNYGIVLDGSFALFDIDRPDLMDIVPEPTWCQQTKKGFHYIYSLCPDDYPEMLHNAKLRNAKGEIYGDLKCKGYFVGPGSIVDGYTYKVINDRPFAGIPDALFEQMEKRPSVSVKSPSAKGVPTGSHDSFLTSLGGWLRGQAALEAPAIKEVLRGAVQVLEGVDESDPYTESDLDRIARSAASYDPVFHIAEDFDGGSVRRLSSLRLWQPTQSWLIKDFLPMGTLSLVFGEGGIGKSTLGSYVCRNAALRGYSSGFCVMEENAELFGARMLFEGGFGEDALYRTMELPRGLMFPRDLEIVRELIEQEKIDVLYFDSIYSHFDPAIQGNEATRARLALGGLAKLAQEMGTAVIGLFHENKAGQFLGSVEMRNVCRSLVHATQDKKTKQLKLKVVKSNYEIPEYSLICLARKFVLRDQVGEAWEREDEEGEIIEREAFGITDLVKLEDGDDTYVIEVDQDFETLREYIERNPSHGERKVHESTGISLRKIRFYKQQGL